MQQINLFPGQEQCYIPPLIHFPTETSDENKEQLILGKKIKNDTDLILWLSGKDINQKNEEEKTVPNELNSKVKKKLRNKLINNAKKCEYYFVDHFSNKEFINNPCPYCLKKIFDHNELLRFVNFQEFVYYLKYLFYLSDQVLSYSSLNFKKNKKEIDVLFSQFKSKEVNWNFDEEKIICKLCLFILVNKPNFLENIKKIFFEGRNDNNLNNDDIVVEINYDEEKCNNGTDEEKKKKKGNNKLNKIKLNNNYMYDIPNRINIYKSKNININISNTNIINNNKNNDDISFYKTFFDLSEKINNNSQEKIKPEEFRAYYKSLFIINHNEIVEDVTDIINELSRLIQCINNINNKNSNNDQYISNIRDMQNKIFLLLIKILSLMANTNNCLMAYLNDYSKININISQIIQSFINQNGLNFTNIQQIMRIFLLACNLFFLPQ